MSWHHLSRRGKSDDTARNRYLLGTSLGKGGTNDLGATGEPQYFTSVRARHFPPPPAGPNEVPRIRSVLAAGDFQAQRSGSTSVLNASTTFAENFFISLINPDVVQARVSAVQYAVFAVYLKSKDGSVGRAEVHLLKASADSLMGVWHVGQN